ncbi:hypothetical protein [Alteromonas lipotrueae]|uniref:hypothetical protein n=1 Tax=Alteromonas lipotrueae TaxID=2803814 RepID=UPI001C44DA13|nr:hypothetical protein [Alteromonas lipotrueae]
MNRELAVNQMKSVFTLLSNDVEEIRVYGKENNNGFAQRTLLRTYFAFIEGMICQLRLVAIATAKDYPDLFSNKEVILLKEERYQLSPKGKLETKANFQKNLPMLLFTINCYTRIHSPDFTVKTDERGWEALNDYSRIRNNLMHPKSLNDLELDGSSLKTSTEAAKWFKSTLLDMFAVCAKAEEHNRNKNCR